MIRLTRSSHSGPLAFRRQAQASAIATAISFGLRPDSRSISEIPDTGPEALPQLAVTCATHKLLLTEPEKNVTCLDYELTCFSGCLS